jgi:predicted nucleic acid-binding protein
MSIIYLDTSALLKLYIQEAYSADVNALVTTADGAGTSILTYTEIAAAMARAERMRIISGESAKSAWNNFLGDWPEFTRLKLSAALTERAATLAWDFGLRGYDAMHLAAALTWQDALGEPISLATFERLLWSAGKKAGVVIWPETLISD